MKRSTLPIAMAFVATLFAGPAFSDEFGFLASMNVQAQANIAGFRVQLSARFGMPEPKVETIIRTVAQPADAYMILRTAELAKQPPERVVTEYQTHKGHGWGVIAKNLGIKPGSAEFHALKQGEVLGGGRAPAGGSGGGPPAGGHGGGPPVGGGEHPGNGRGRGHNK